MSTGEKITDQLFYCVYAWVKGHPVDKRKNAAAVKSCPDEGSRMRKLAEKIAELSNPESYPYETLCEMGLITTDAAEQEKTRLAVVREFLTDDEVKALLCDAERANRLFPQPKPTAKKKPAKGRRGELTLLQMADNEKALLLASRYDGIAIHSESEAVYLYRGGVWEKASPLELSREMVAVYNENQANFSKRAFNNVIEALKIVIPVMGEPRRSLTPFANGVYDMGTGEFSAHTPENWLTNHNGVMDTQPVQGENLHDHAPNFHKWLSYTANIVSLKQ